MPVRFKFRWPHLLPIFLIIFFLSMFSGRRIRTPWYEQLFSNFVYPAQWITTQTSEGISGVFKDYFFLVGVKRENILLKNKIKVFSGELITYDENKLENQRLKKFLNLQIEEERQGVIAKVIAYDPRKEFKSILINRGEKDGIASNMPVVSPEGLIGRVGPVFSNRAEVLLITDPNSAVDVMVIRSRVQALLVGTSKNVLMKHKMDLGRLEYLRRQSDIQEGDVVATFGSDQIFPKGIPVGEISEIKNEKYGIFQEALVVPIVDFQKIEEVFVLKP